MNTHITAEKALTIVKVFNKEPFHIRHAITVGAVMREFAIADGFAKEADFWEVVGILHDVDFEEYPEEHCVKAPELLSAYHAENELIHAICSHGFGGTETTTQPEHHMEKILFAVDELTGLIGAAALMRPSKSCKDMELKSLKKKYKDKKFAAGCSRETIAQGSELLDLSLEVLLEQTLEAMRATEDIVEAATKEATKDLV